MNKGNQNLYSPVKNKTNLSTNWKQNKSKVPSGE